MSINTVCSSLVKKQLFNRREADGRDGLLLRIHHTSQENTNEQVLRFIHATFNALGGLLAISNIRGDIYLVNLLNNKYWLLQSFTSCTILKFSPVIREELLVGQNGGDVSIVNTENAEIKTTLKEHKDSVVGISFNSNGDCLCFSKMDAILWNLRECVKIVTVCCNCNTAIKEILFVPTSNYIVGYDQDDIINIWDSKNYDVIKQIVPATWDKFRLKSVAFTRDGRTMVLAGTAPQIAVYYFDVWSIVKILKLANECKGSQKIDFISQPFDAGASRLLAVLGTNGIVYIYNMEKDELLTQVSSETQTKRMELSADGKYFVNILATGQLFVYSIAVIINNITTNDSKELIKYEVRNVILPKRSSYILTELKKELGKMLETDKLKLILKEFNEYPNVYRHRIWSQLLKLPHNSQQYNTFVIGKEKHDFLTKLSEAYPLENQMALKSMKNLISDIIFWCPFFYSVEYLPLFVFPVMRVFKNDPVACFEAVITIIMNWCQFWFEYHPLPPLNILAIIENVLLESDATLLSHFTRYDISTNLYAWPLMESIFSEVLLSRDWLLLWDHILTNETSFLLFAPVAYSICQRNALLSLNCKEQFQQFFHQQNPIDMKRFINKIYSLLENTIDNNHPRHYLTEFKPLEAEFYPTFHQFPSVFNLQYYDDLLGFEQQSVKLLDTVDSNLNAVKLEEHKHSSDYQKERVENIRLIEMGRILREETNRDRINVTLQINKLSKLQDELRNEQQTLFDSTKTKNCNIIKKDGDQDARINGRNVLGGENDMLNRQGFVGEKVTNYKVCLKELKMATDQMISKVHQQIEMSTMQPLAKKTISRLMAETNEIQNVVRNLLNSTIKFE